MRQSSTAISVLCLSETFRGRSCTLSVQNNRFALKGDKRDVQDLVSMRWTRHCRTEPRRVLAYCILNLRVSMSIGRRPSKRPGSDLNCSKGDDERFYCTLVLDAIKFEMIGSRSRSEEADLIREWRRISSYEVQCRRFRSENSVEGEHRLPKADGATVDM